MFMSERHQEGLAHLLYGINQGGGFVALTGEVGTGKTTLCRCLLQQLPHNVDIALILNPKLNAIELLSTLCDELGIEYDPTWPRLKTLVDKINQHLLDAYSKGRTTVLLIDEAQNLSMEVLEQIRLLTNLETSKTKLLQIVLVGQPELKDILNQRELRQLSQRITARYHLLPLSRDETCAYIRHRLKVCNGNPNLFKDGATRMVYRLSSGIPRVINILCDRAMLGAYATNVRTISPRIINHAARETLGTTQSTPSLKILTTVILLGSVAAAIHFFNQPSPLFQSSSSSASEKHPTAGSELSLKNPQAPSKPKVSAFETWLENPSLSQNTAMIQALKVWNKPLPANERLDCDHIATTGLQCFFDQASWKGMLTFDRPTILEFSLRAGEKRYALLTGIDKQQAVLRLDGNLSFPVTDIKKFWTGHFLMLWRPPRPGMVNLAPPYRADAATWLHKQLDSGTKRRAEASKAIPSPIETLKSQVINFQRQHRLSADGIVGARTLIHLDNKTGATDSPHLKITH